MASKSQYNDEWQAENIRRFVLKLSRVSEGEMIRHLEGMESMQGYIKRLIREDMARDPSGKITPPQTAGEMTAGELREVIREAVKEALREGDQETPASE